VPTTYRDSIDLSYNEILNTLLQNLGSDPGTGVNTGRIYFSTALDAIRVRGNSAWITIAALSTEDVQDIVGAFFADTATIDVTYNDAGNALSAAVLDSPLLQGQNGAYYLNRGNHTSTQAPATITFANTDRLLGRDTASGGTGEEITVGGGIEFTGSGGIQRSAFTGGDVTGSAASANLAIVANAVTNAKLATMPANTIKANNTGGIAVPTDVTVANFKTMLGYNGTEVAFTPAGNIVANTVSAAISELESDMTTLITSTLNAQTWKDPVDAATTAALPAITYNAGAGTLTEVGNGALPAQDGITLAANEDLLVKDQASSFQDGIYTVTSAGSAGTPFVLTRRSDADSATELRDAAVHVEAGTLQGGDIYTQSVATLADLTSATQTWIKTGDTNVVYTSDGTTIQLVGNSFRVAAGAAGAGLTGGGGAALDVIAAATPGTGGPGGGLVVSSNDVAIDKAVVSRGYATTLTGGATSEVVTHNLNTRDVVIQVYLNSGSYATEIFPAERTSVNTVTIRSSVNIPAGYRVVVQSIGG
jgi:hypothetical protein